MARILVVDDDVSFNETLKQYLEYVGHEVICAFDGGQGLRLFEQETPDLVITDIVMPDVDGMEFLFKAMDDILHIPCKIIAISGGGRIGGKEYLATAKVLGADDILEKPFRRADLLKRIENLLS